MGYCGTLLGGGRLKSFCVRVLGKVGTSYGLCHLS